MTATGVHTIAATDYHGDPAPDPSLSAHIAQLLCERSAWHAWTAHPRLNPDYQTDEAGKFDLGTAAHALLLQGEQIVHEVEAADWRTKDAQEVRAKARENGLIPLLTHQWEQVQQMVAAVREQLARLEVDPAPLVDGDPEQTLVWQEPNGVWCRARLDWLHTDGRAVDDLKTTGRSADPRQWARTTMWSIGADVQAAFYLRGLQAVRGEAAAFRFVVCETEPPYAVSMVAPSSAVLELATAKVEWAIERWAECVESDEWPGYPQEVAYAELPEWAHARWLERTWSPETEAYPERTHDEARKAGEDGP